MKQFFFLFGLVGVIYGAGGDTLVYDATFEAFTDGDTIYSLKHFHNPHDSVKAIINGRLGNINISATANIDPAKLDSTKKAVFTRVDCDTIMSDIFGFDSVTATVKIDAPRGYIDTLFLVDKITGNPVFDSLTGVSVIAGASGITRLDTIHVDSINSTNGINTITINTGNGNAEVYLQNQNLRTTDDLIFDSLKVTKIVSSGVVAVDSLFSTKGILGTTVNTGNGNVECYEQNQNLRSTDDVTFDSAIVTKLGIGSAPGNNKLKVYSNTNDGAASSLIENASTGDGAYCGLYLNAGSGGSQIYQMGSGNTTSGGKYAANSFTIENNTNAVGADVQLSSVYKSIKFWTGQTERLRIDSSGKVGINDETPDARLDVAGSAIIDTNLTVTGTATVGNIYTTDWTDYSATSTISGFSGTPADTVWYRKIGKQVSVGFKLAGTVNAPIVQFTVPDTAVSHVFTVHFPVKAFDEVYPAHGYLSPNTRTVIIEKDWDASSASFTGGAMTFEGYFQYEAK